MNSVTDTPAILVVDDEDVIRYFLERFLLREGYRVTAVASGEAALRASAETEFEVVLLDLKMKGIGGLEVLAALRQRWPATSVIVLTAHASLESAVEALRHGAHDYLFKPCRTGDLRDSINSALVRRQERLQIRPVLDQSPVIESRSLVDPQLPSPTIDGADRFLKRHGLIVDNARHVVTVDNVLLDLSPTEFSLLAYLVREAPRVVPPQELIREVHHYDPDAQEAAETVRSHIYHIRQKAVVAVNRPIIRTIRGIGYALEE